MVQDYFFKTALINEIRFSLGTAMGKKEKWNQSAKDNNFATIHLTPAKP